jgi:hypothetical protein
VATDSPAHPPRLVARGWAPCFRHQFAPRSEAERGRRARPQRGRNRQQRTRARPRTAGVTGLPRPLETADSATREAAESGGKWHVLRWSQSRISRRTNGFRLGAGWTPAIAAIARAGHCIGTTRSAGTRHAGCAENSESDGLAIVHPSPEPRPMAHRLRAAREYRCRSHVLANFVHFS